MEYCRKRKRIILIGVRKDLNISFDFAAIQKVNNDYVVNDILKDLDKLSCNMSSYKYQEETNTYLQQFGIRNEQENILTQHEARMHNSRDLEIYRKMVSSWNDGRRLKYNELPSSLQTHKNRESFLDRFKVVDGNSHCHTNGSAYCKGWTSLHTSRYPAKQKLDS